MYFTLGAALLIIIVLAIALPLALKTKDDQQPDNPPPKPVPPYVPIDEDNPYAVDANSIETSPSSLKGIIRSPKNY